MKKVYIIIVNYNGWKDTIECLESVMKLQYLHFQVIVVDNASTNNSLANIKAWAQGNMLATCNNPELSHYTTPPIQKPIVFTFIKASNLSNITLADEKLVIIDAEKNAGFAAGNNIGIRYAKHKNDYDYIWLLNNDTITRPDCLTHMVNRSENHMQKNSCGAKVLYYYTPDTIQALGGGRYNRFTGIAATTLGRDKKITATIDYKFYEKQLDYITGACWLLPKNFIEETGLMSEEYFLYFEEIDWCLRAKTFDKIYAEQAIIYHKEGSSIGSPSQKRQASLLSDYYIFRNKLKVIAKFYPFSYPIAYLVTVLQMIKRIIQGHWKKAGLMVAILLGIRFKK